MFKKLKSIRGVTLIETMVALLLVGIVTAAMFKAYINQHHAWMIQDSVIEMQQNARAAIDELTRQIRMTGYAVPNGQDPLTAYNADPDTIVVYYKAIADCDATIEHPMPLPSSELRCDGHDISCFFDGQEAYIYDPFLDIGEFFEISHVQAAAYHIQHNDDPLGHLYPQGSTVMSLDRVKFYIDNVSDTLHPKLMVQVGNQPAQVYAEDIIDLQFEYTLKNGMSIDEPSGSMVRDVRQVSITITARTPRPDHEFSQNPYRYETYQSKVHLRNL